MKKSGFHRRPGCQVQKFGYVVVSFVIQDNQMSEKAKKTSIDDLYWKNKTDKRKRYIGVNKTRLCACKLSYFLLY